MRKGGGSKTGNPGLRHDLYLASPLLACLHNPNANRLRFYQTQCLYDVGVVLLFHESLHLLKRQRPCDFVFTFELAVDHYHIIIMSEIDFTGIFEEGNMNLAVEHSDVKHILRCEAHIMSHTYIVYTYTV